MPIDTGQFGDEERSRSQVTSDAYNRLAGRYNEDYYHEQAARNREGYWMQKLASAGRGGLKLIENTVNLPTDLAGFPKLIEPTKAIERREGWQNHLLENVVDYAGAFIGTGKIKWLKDVGKIEGLKKGARATNKEKLKGAAISGLARGSAADFLAFDGSESLVLSLLDLHPELHQPYDKITAVPGWENMSAAELEAATYGAGWSAKRLAANWGGRMFNAGEGAFIQSFLQVFWKAAKIKFNNDKMTIKAGEGLDPKIQEGVDKTAAVEKKRRKAFIDPDKDLTPKQRQEKAAWTHASQKDAASATEDLAKKTEAEEMALEKAKADLASAGEAAKGKEGKLHEAAESDTLAPRAWDDAEEAIAAEKQGATARSAEDGIDDGVFELTGRTRHSKDYNPHVETVEQVARKDEGYGTPLAPKASPIYHYSEEVADKAGILVDTGRLRQVWDFFHEEDTIKMLWRNESIPHGRMRKSEFWTDGPPKGRGAGVSRNYDRAAFNSFDEFQAFVIARGKAEIKYPLLKGESLPTYHNRLDKAAANTLKRQGLGNFWKYELDPVKGMKQFQVDLDTYLKRLFNNTDEAKSILADLKLLKEGKAVNLNEIFLRAQKILNIDSTMTDSHLKYFTSRIMHFFMKNMRDGFGKVTSHSKHDQLASAIQWMGEGSSRKSAKDWIQDDLLNHIDNIARANKLSPQGVIERIRSGRGDFKDLWPGMKIPETPLLKSMLEDVKVTQELYIRTWAYRLNTVAVMKKFDLAVDRVIREGDEAADGVVSNKSYAEMAVEIEKVERHLHAFRNLGTAHGRNLASMKALHSAGLGGPAAEKEILEEIIGRGGGTKGLQQLAVRLKAVRDAHGGTGSEGSAFIQKDVLHKTVTGIDVHNEYWLNSILSGGRTQIVNAIGTLLHLVLKPVEGALGTLGRDPKNRKYFISQGVYAANLIFDTMKFTTVMMKNRTQKAVGSIDEKQYMQKREDMLSPVQESQSFRQADGSLGKAQLIDGNTNHAAGTYAAAKKAFHSGKSVLESRSQLFDVTPHQAINRELLPESASELAKDSLDYLGNIIRIPSRFMIATDEVFKQIQYRSASLAKLTQEALENLPKSKHNTEEMTQYIAARFQGLIRGNGARYTPKAVEDEAMTNFYRAVARSEETGEAMPKEMLKRDDYVAGYFAKNYKKDKEVLADFAMDWAEDTTFTRGLDVDLLRMQEHGHLQGKKSVNKAVQDFVADHSFMRIMAPFVRTPVQLVSFPLRRIWLPDSVMRGIINKPDGWLKKTHLRYQADILSKDPIRAAEAYGRMRMGMLMYGSLMSASAMGMVTGRGPRDTQKRNQQMATGYRSYSVKVGDKYVSYARLDPFATVLGLAADFTYMIQESAQSGDFNKNWLESMLLAGVYSIADNITSKSYLENLSNVVGAVTNPESGGAFETFMERHTASYVPKALSQFTPITDGAQMRKPRGLAESIQNQIPFLSSGIEPLRNLLGQEMNYVDAGVMSRSISIVNPFMVKTREGNHVLEILAGLDYAFELPSPKLFGKAELDLREFKDEDGRSAYDWMQERTGTIKDKDGYTLFDRLAMLFKTKLFKELTAIEDEDQWQQNVEDDMRIPLVKVILQEFRKMARADTRRNYPEIDRVRLSLAMEEAGKKEKVRQRMKL